MARTIGIGNQDFGDIITKNCFYTGQWEICAILG